MENHVDSSKSQQDTPFVPPRHWIAPEELESSYWNDPKAQEKRAQEFHDKPVETIDLIDRFDQKGIARRDFLTIMGASMAMASFACARRPVHKIIPYVVKPEEITPGVANFYASTSPETGYGLLVKTREGRPIKLEGNPDHPLNRGALDARSQSAILDLYDPDRLKEPVSHSRNGGTATNVAWGDADSAIQARLKSLSNGSGRVRILSGRIEGDATRRLIREFLGSFGNSSLVEWEPLALDEISESQAECYGTAVTPVYRFDLAEYVLSLGGDFLGTWPSSVEYAAAWSKRRKLNGAQAGASSFSKLVTFESTMTVTGANSDERFPVRPGDELKIVLAIAHELILNQKQTRFVSDSTVITALNGYRPESIATEIGLAGGAEAIKKLATELWQSRGKSLVVGGGTHSKTRDSLALQIAINFLNTALENDGATVDSSSNPSAGVSVKSNGFAGVSKLIADMKSGAVDLLIIYRSNPLYALPKSLGFEDAMKRVSMVVSVCDREDETALLSDFALPDHHFLENWGDSHPRKSVYSLQQPVIAPIHSTRAFQDSLLVWVKGAGLKTSGLAPRIAQAAAGSNSWHDYLVGHWRETVYREAGAAGSFEQFWEGALRQGVVDFGSAPGSMVRSGPARSFRAASLLKVPQYRPMSEDIYLALYASVAMHDGRTANNAWLQELADPISTVTWDNYLNVSSQMAKKLNLNNSDVVEVKVGDASVELPVYVQPGLHPNVISVAVGYGRRAAGKVGTGVGVDVFQLARAEGDRLVFSGQLAKIRKTGRFYQLGMTQWHNVSENRPIINDITLSEYKKDPGHANHTDPHLRLESVPSMWPAHEYKGYRWGMAIDLSSCIGCGACVIGCQAENNIPVVGRNNVRVSRQMHWIRIDRYYSGSAENPDVVFQPMLCQHCENAPCETVCPVLATIHGDEGLNEQVYNRCVGTRYCQNNCPYKVRRFNFFDHWKSYEGTMNLVWNPEVTVRTRGIMEKCTFCIQRIRSAKDHAKDEGELVSDGQLKTACQQTCPTDAITFGNINDPNSRVSKLREDPRAFRVLEILNTKPSISYLTKVRNKEEGADHANGHSHS